MNDNEIKENIALKNARLRMTNTLLNYAIWGARILAILILIGVVFTIWQHERPCPSDNPDGLGVICRSVYTDLNSPTPGVLSEEAMIDRSSVVRAKVLEVLSTGTQLLANNKTGPTQQVALQLLNGPQKGQVVTINNSYIMLSKGDRAFLAGKYAPLYTVYTLEEPDRLPALAFFVFLFISLAIFFGGIQGIRGLISLAGSFFFILYILLPGILHGYSALLLSIGVAALIIILGSYVTHGFNKTTSSAVIGMIITIIITGLLAVVAIHATKLNGVNTEESVSLNFDTFGNVNLVGLLLGAMIIGVLGVLYDAAIGQAISVEELHRVAPHLSPKIIYKRAIRIGREHIGALVNMLAIAYVGVSLPLLLLYVQTNTGSPFQVINQQLFATEIVRTMVGSIGLILAVPITTALAVFILIKKPKNLISEESIEKEKEAILHFHHH